MDAESRQPCSQSDVTCSNDIYYGQFIGAARLRNRSAISHLEINFRGILQANARGCNVPTLLPERSLALELSLSFVFLVANWISVLWLSVNFLNLFGLIWRSIKLNLLLMLFITVRSLPVTKRVKISWLFETQGKAMLHTII